MTCLPILERELMVAARRAGTYRIRLLVAAVAVVICGAMVLTIYSRQTPPAFGQSMIRILSMLGLGFSLLSGVFVTSDCISAEKREGTLRLLFLTDLSGPDIIMGKLLARSLGVCYGLLACLPLLAVPVLLGGVTRGELVRLALVIANSFYLSLAAGIFISCLSRDGQKSRMATLVLILGLVSFVPGLGMLITAVDWAAAQRLHPLLSVNPLYNYSQAFDAAFRLNPSRFWISWTGCHALGWFFLIAASLFVGRTGIMPSVAPTPVSLKAAKWRRARLARQRSTLERNPVYFVAHPDPWQLFFVWFLVLLVGINVYWLTYGYNRLANAEPYRSYFGTTIYFLNRIWIASQACRFLNEARRSGALELLLATPLSVAKILQGQLLALRRLFLWPVLAIALLHVLYLVGTYSVWGSPNVRWTGFRFQIAVALGSFFSFAFDILALSWTGMWFALCSRRANVAVLKTFGYVIVLPWLVSYFISHFRLFLPSYSLGFIVVRSLVWVIKDLLFIWWARRKLRRRFREVASQMFAPELWTSRSWSPWGRAKTKPLSPPAMAT